MIVDLFSGPRGWSEGLRMLGLTDIGLELDTAACRTAVAAGHPTIQCDVTQYPTRPFAGHARRDVEWVRIDGATDLEKRPLLLTEAAVLQGFEPSHPFHGSESARFLQIANAVPPPLAAHIVAAATGLPAPAPAAIPAACGA